jgi:hypothetical protein
MIFIARIIQSASVYGSAGSVPFQSQRYGRAGCVPFYRQQYGRAVCTPFLNAGMSDCPHPVSLVPE